MCRALTNTIPKRLVKCRGGKKSCEQKYNQEIVLACVLINYRIHVLDCINRVLRLGALKFLRDLNRIYCMNYSPNLLPNIIYIHKKSTQIYNLIHFNINIQPVQISYIIFLCDSAT